MIGKHLFKKSMFIAFTMLELTTSLSAAPNPRRPDPEQFILVDSSSKRPLGYAYTPPNEAVGDEYSSGKVLRNRINHGENLVVKKEKNYNRYGRFDFRSSESTSGTNVDIDANAEQKELGDFMFKYKATSRGSKNTLYLDLFQFFSPFHEYIDDESTEFKYLVQLEKSHYDPFKFLCTYRRSHGKDKQYRCLNPYDEFRPASLHADELLSLCGTHVIARHYYGVAYRRTIKFVFQSEKQKKDFEASLAVDLKNISPDTKAEISAKIESDLMANNTSFENEHKDLSFTRLTRYISENGYSDLVDEFHEKEKVLNGARKVSEVVAAAYELYQVLSQVGDAFNQFDYEDEELKQMFPVVAAGPGNHEASCCESFPSLGFALGCAWNNVTGNQSTAEKKEKGKKL
ncbi:MAG: hypothetical protein HRU09_14525 [Oligoflexales bacterium]|nr:hypothetical protein [Oligoflexales bacterium]